MITRNFQTKPVKLSLKGAQIYYLFIIPYPLNASSHCELKVCNDSKTNWKTHKRNTPVTPNNITPALGRTTNPGCLSSSMTGIASKSLPEGNCVCVCLCACKTYYKVHLLTASSTWSPDTQCFSYRSAELPQLSV